jgi:hypothetical protein
MTTPTTTPNEAEPLTTRLKKLLAGDKAAEEIKSGTLATTRGSGYLAVILVGVLIGLDGLGWDRWDSLGNSTKWWIGVAIVAAWTAIAAADSIARGIASSKPDRSGVAMLPTGVEATLTTGTDRNVHVLAVRLPEDDDPGKATWLVAEKDGSAAKATWVEAKELKFPATT